MRVVREYGYVVFFRLENLNFKCLSGGVVGQLLNSYRLIIQLQVAEQFSLIHKHLVCFYTLLATEVGVGVEAMLACFCVEVALLEQITRRHVVFDAEEGRHCAHKHSEASGQMEVTATVPDGGEQHLFVARVARHQQCVSRGEETAQIDFVFLAETVDGGRIHLQRSEDGMATKLFLVKVGLQEGVHIVANIVLPIPLLVVFQSSPWRCSNSLRA